MVVEDDPWRGAVIGVTAPLTGCTPATGQEWEHSLSANYCGYLNLHRRSFRLALQLLSAFLSRQPSSGGFLAPNAVRRRKCNGKALGGVHDSGGLPAGGSRGR